MKHKWFWVWEATFVPAEVIMFYYFGMAAAAVTAMISLASWFLGVEAGVSNK